QNGAYLILTDGNSNILIYGSKDEYDAGTKISSITGTVSPYNNLFELANAELTVGGTGASYSPKTIASFANINYTDNLFDEVIINKCSITGKSGKAATIELGDETIAMYNNFNLDFDNGVDYDITGFVWRNKDVLQISPIAITGGVAQETVKTPAITPTERELNPGDKVTITCATAGASIYYTLDDSEPTETSTLYTAPFTFTEDCTVKARAYKEGMIHSEIAEKAYHVFDPTCNVITADNHEGAGSYTAHTCTVDGVDYAMMGMHGVQGIQMNNKADQFCYIIQTGENGDYVLKSIAVDFSSNNNNISFKVKGSNEKFTDEDIADKFANKGVEIGTILKIKKNSRCRRIALCR
ncbi:MAG: chitobiase/beta-hexosaminidase C-terminal domain-containing protein, partial [Muribaculaceae bacterium]|nr:chitobiase/beta-hexosaminidase C-terminal domain-containing protein [Muribaculaceae bacterium]